MKLPVAVAVLVLVLVAHSEAQEEPTIEQRFATFQNQMKDFTDGIIGKTKSALEDFHQSDFVVNSKNWFTEQFEKMKQKIDETFQK